MKKAKLRMNKRFVANWIIALVIFLLLAFLGYVFSFNGSGVKALPITTYIYDAGIVPFDSLNFALSLGGEGIISYFANPPLLAYGALGIIFQLAIWIIAALGVTVFVVELIQGIRKSRKFVILYMLLSLLFAYIGMYIVAALGYLLLPDSVPFPHSVTFPDNYTSGLLYAISAFVPTANSGKFFDGVTDTNILLTVFAYIFAVSLIIVAVSMLVITIYILRFLRRIRMKTVVVAENGKKVTKRIEDIDREMAEGNDDFANLPYSVKNNVVVPQNGAPYVVQYFNTYPGAQPAPEKAELTKEEISKIFAEEFEKALGPISEYEDFPIDEDYEYYDYESLKESMKNEILEELSEENKKNAETIKNMSNESKGNKEEATVAYDRPVNESEVDANSAAAEGTSSESEVKVTTPIVVAVPSDYEEEVAEEPVEEITAQDIRDLVNEELASALKDLIPAKAEPAARPRKRVEPIIKYEYEDEIVEVVAQPKEEPKPVVIEKPKKVEAPKKRKEIRGRDNAIDRIETSNLNFAEKVVASPKEIRDAYQELKSLLLSYGLNDRISSTGDTFRLHKKTYCKISTTGSGLRMYLALDPKAYAESALPISDVSNSDTFKDIPLSFRIKSELSLRRAKDLIIACMQQNNLTQIENFKEGKYVAELRKLNKNASK